MQETRTSEEPAQPSSEGAGFSPKEPDKPTRFTQGVVVLPQIIRLVGFFFAYLLLSSVCLLIAGPAMVEGEEVTASFETGFQLLGFEVALTLSTILFIAWRLRAHKEGAADIGLSLRREWLPSLAFGPALGLFVKVASIPIAILAYLFGAEAEMPTMDLAGPWNGLAAVAGGALAGVHEELAFRGYIRIRLAKILRDPVPGGGLWRTGLVTSVVFGSLHGYQGWIGIVTTAVVGLMFFAIATSKRFGLLHAILAHATFNAIAFAFLAALE